MRALLAVADMRQFARLAVEQLQALGAHGTQLAWTLAPERGPVALHCWPPGPVDPALPALLAGARTCEIRSGTGACQGELDWACLLVDDGRQRAFVSSRRHGERSASPPMQSLRQDTIGVLALRCESLLQAERLRGEVERLGHAERVQRALYAISECATSDRDLPDVLHEMHDIVGRLMYARNFFIVHYRTEPETMRFLYFADSLDRNRRDPEEVVDAALLEGSLTLAMLRHGQPLHGHGDDLRERLHLPRSDRVGPASVDWLGVPMLENGEVRGAVVVQSYDPAIAYSDEDQALLAYLAQNIGAALARRETAVDLERRVSERTLALREEIAERQRGERLQALLFRIAEVAGEAGSMASFYKTIHGIVGELLDARNFFICILSEDGSQLTYPFIADDYHEQVPPRPRGRSLSDYVLRHGRPVLLDLARATALRDAGELEWLGTPAASWLGVPLKIDERVFGLIAVQSYRQGFRYGERDKELLSFVAAHIANAFERRRTAESLRQANQQLEHVSRTDPLTGLHNRRYLANQIPIDLNFYERERARTGLDDKRLVFAIVDIDHFKRINDSHGHAAGDRALQVFGAVLAGLVQTGDYVVRWGGEEFLLVFRPMPGDAVPALGERIRRRVAERVYEVADDIALPLNCSIGLAEYPILGDTGHELGWERAVELADAALYWVKNHGRDGWAILRPTPDADPAELLASLRAGSQSLLASPQLRIVSSHAGK
ncbi:MAG: diguanylate cyclase [Proteobacteria bacterium]|nr:diguanylate cyclase [Pseudomonadota bacterium]